MFNALHTFKRRQAQRLLEISGGDHSHYDDSSFQELLESVTPLYGKLEAVLGTLRGLKTAVEAIGKHYTELGTYVGDFGQGTPDRLEFTTALNSANGEKAQILIHTIDEAIEQVLGRQHLVSEIQRETTVRTQLLLDFNSYTRKVAQMRAEPSKFDPDHTARREQKLASATNAFNEKDEMMRSDLRYLQGLAPRICEVELEMIKEAVRDYVQQMTASFAPLTVRSIDSVRKEVEEAANAARAEFSPPLDVTDALPERPDHVPAPVPRKPAAPKPQPAAPEERAPAAGHGSPPPAPPRPGASPATKAAPPVPPKKSAAPSLPPKPAHH